MLEGYQTVVCCLWLTQHVLLQVPDTPPSKDSKGNGAGKDKKNH